MNFHKNTYISTLLAGVALLFSACSEGDKVIDEVFDNETRGAVLRTVEILENEVAINASDGSLQGGGFGVVLEEQDQEGGDLLAFVEVFASFADNNDGGDDNRDEVKVDEIDASEFSVGEFGYPRTEYSITAEELLSVLNISSTEIFGGDQFRVRFELVLTDGRRYSFADNTGTLTGSFFSSPFQYNANVVCAPSAPTAGDWVFELNDSYGDGWNGASLTVTIDGEETTVELLDGSSATEIVTVPAGSEVISIIYNSGDWDSEVTFEITSANGNVVSSEGPNPPVGVELLDYCPNNL